MSMYVACTPASSDLHAEPGGCRVVCTDHGVRDFFGTDHRAALGALRAHRAAVHP